MRYSLLMLYVKASHSRKVSSFTHPLCKLAMYENHRKASVLSLIIKLLIKGDMD